MNKKPELIISSLDADRLYDLMESLPAGSFAGEKELEAELGRATIVEPKDMPSTVVTMNSIVNFIVESTKEEFTKTLVYPKNADASADKISILAPVGSALLGLSQGDEIEWPKPSGGLIKVKIKAITYQPERAGELHR
ncbi:nucleoside diphosphate kinase regulator [Pseudoalteromonas ostreae]|uniref:nucleoside diphosphate kinase regulator n=1 Tax=Pseudoalteromonas ostreae TaxID=2774154 RepID=UPI001B35C8E6|nr:nucleoside diphosphate kinase regulator [Pseudoalteromonas ostreae]